jgi:hypothetical protein
MTDPNQIIEVREIHTGKHFAMTVTDLLTEINRDRSDQWTPYNLTDWEQGWYEWCDGDYYEIV